MEERIGHILRWARGEVAPPVKFDIFLTNRCNLLCRFCHYPFLPPFRYQDELGHREILSLVRQAGEMGAKVFGILGGEPFLKKKTALEAMETAKQTGMSGAVVTNGTLLTEKDMRRIIAMRWDLLRFSIDAPTASIHDGLRGIKGSFDKAVRALDRLQALKKSDGSSCPTVEINMVLTRRNIASLSAMMRWASEHHVQRIYVLPVIEFGRDISDLKLSEMDAKTAQSSLLEAEEVSKELGIGSNLATIRRDSLFVKSNRIDTLLMKTGETLRRDDGNCGSTIPCFFPWYAMSVDAQGWITPCGQVETSTRINVRDFRTLRDAWMSPYFISLRSEMARKRLPSGCERCCMPLFDENAQLREALAGRKFPPVET